MTKTESREELAKRLIGEVAAEVKLGDEQGQRTVAILRSLFELSEWMRSNTGPRDGTIEMLTRAGALLEASGVTLTAERFPTAPIHRSMYPILCVEVGGRLVTVARLVELVESVAGSIAGRREPVTLSGKAVDAENGRDIERLDDIEAELRRDGLF